MMAITAEEERTEKKRREAIPRNCALFWRFLRDEPKARTHGIFGGIHPRDARREKKGSDDGRAAERWQPHKHCE